MPLARPCIPYGAYWSTPFCRWQGSFSRENSVELAARVAAGFLERSRLEPALFDGVVLGTTVPQRFCFYGAPWLAGLIGAGGITGPNVSQACATSVRMLATAAFEVEAEARRCVLAVACDRTSNGPHIYYPNPQGIGGMGEAENPVWDNFGKDPHAGSPMIQTAENVAREAGISRAEQDEMALLRFAQYQDALSNERAFQRRYMVPAEVKADKRAARIEADEGVFPTTREGLARLRPVLEDGTVTYGSQTFPADGNAGLVVCTEEQARSLGRDGVTIRILGFGEARVRPAFMPMAVVPAARQALERAGIDFQDCRAIKTHNPFAVNDVYFCREAGVRPEAVNRFGSPLIWGHPQGPTGARAIIELIEELVQEGGGYGLFSGCAAGDTAMAVVVRVE